MTHSPTVWGISRGLLVGLGLCLLAAAWADRPAWAEGQSFVLQSIRGRVEVRAGGKGEWKAAKRGKQQVAVGDHVRTGRDSSVHIVSDDGTRVAVGANTEVVLREPNRPHGWRLLLGRMVAYLVGSSRVEVRTPGAVAAAEGTVFALDVREDGTSVLTVVEGTVQFYNELGAVTVLGSEQSTARVGEAPTRPIAVDPSSLTAWEADLQTMTVPLEYPLVSTDPVALAAALSDREQAAQARPADAAVQAALAEVLLDLGRTEEAVDHAQQATALAPDLAEASGALGYALLQAGRPSEAAAQFAAATATEPGEPRWQIGAGLVALGQRDPGPALEILRRATETVPADARPWTYLAAAYLRAGDLGQAEAAVTQAVTLSPGSALPQTYLVYVRLAQGRLEEATAAGQKAVAAAPNSSLAHEALGNALFFSSRPAQAAQELDRAISLDPASASAHLSRAKLLVVEGQLDRALEEGQLAASLDPQSAPARSTLGLLYLITHDPQRAGHQFSEAMALNPSLSQAHTGWGKVLFARGRFREAMEQQKLAVALDTDSAAAENNLGGVLASLGRMPEAEQHLRRAIELQPGWAMPYANLAALYLELNRFPEALTAADRAVALGDRSAFVHTVMARICEHQGRVDRALIELREAVAADGLYPPAHLHLAKLYLDEGRSRDAVREILFAVTTDPSAMLDTRLYARTQTTLTIGSDGASSRQAEHSAQAAEGRVSYYASGLADSSDGWRPRNQDGSERFAELILGDQPNAARQLAVFSTFLDHDNGLPGPRIAGASGDPDDRQEFAGYDAVVAYRQRVTRALTGTLKYSYRRSALDFHNPDSLSAFDRNPFSRLQTGSSECSPEVRLDSVLSDHTTLRIGYAGLSSRGASRGLAAVFDPATGEIVPYPFANDSESDTSAAWLEAETRFSPRLDLTVGGYWGRESGADHVLAPKLVALYQPHAATWWALLVTPVFRSDVSELAPVEALADPPGLSHLNFSGRGSGQTYELRFQRQGARASTFTGSLGYQSVQDLLVDIEDPAWTGLPGRALLTRGERWIATTSYERWISRMVVGRTWAEWQQSRGDFPGAAATDVSWPHTPAWRTGARIDRIVPSGWHTSLEAVVVGRQFGDAENLRALPAHAVISLQAQWQQDLHRGYFVSVTNLTGRGYETFAGFPQPGRSLLAGLTYRF